MSTSRTCSFRFTNNWGVDMVSVTLRHLKSNDATKKDEKTWNNVKASESTGYDLEVHYEAGSGADRDCWWVTFQLGNGDVYSSKDDFRCNLETSDEDGKGSCSVDQQGTRFTVTPPKSSACTTDSVKKTS